MIFQNHSVSGNDRYNYVPGKFIQQNLISQSGVGNNFPNAIIFEQHLYLNKSVQLVASGNGMYVSTS